MTNLSWINLTLLAITAYLLYAYISKSNAKRQEMEDWFKENHLEKIRGSILKAGYTYPEHLAFALDTAINDIFPDIPPKVVNRDKFDQLLKGLREQFILREWLHQNGFTDIFQRARLQTEAATLDEFVSLSERQFYQLTDSFLDYIALRNIVSSMETNSIKWPEYKQSLLNDYYKRNDLMVYLGEKLECVVSMIVTVGALVVSVYMTNQQRFTHPQATPDGGSTWHDDAPWSLFDTIFGGTSLSSSKTEVDWGWSDPDTVGKTVTFSIKHFTKNNKPYPISTSDPVLVEVTHENTPVTISVEHGHTDPKKCNISTVQFAVHRAGTYRVTIMINAVHIRGSPFFKFFRSGPIDPNKTCFVQHSSIVVCAQSLVTPLYIEPRDEYGNLCTYDPDELPPCQYDIKVTESGTNIAYNPSVHFTYELNCKRFILNLRMYKLGCFRVAVSINGQRIKNGDFDAIVLTETDIQTVKKNVSRSHTAWYEARQVSRDVMERRDSNRERGKKVFCYISPRQLVVKEFYFKFIPKRIYSFRVCPSTKFIFNGHNNIVDMSSFTIDDGCQPPREFASKDTRLIAATYNDFLLRNIGGSETFRDKQDFFYHEIRQYHSKHHHDRQAIAVCRHSLLESVMKATKQLSISDWCRNFEITFVGEAGLDWGGLRREFFELVCTELFDPLMSGLFHRFAADSQCLVHPNPNRRPYLKLKYYEFAGRIVGKCLYESSLGGGYRQCVKARFTRSFLAQVIGLRVNYRHFEQDDPELFTTKIRYILDHDLSDMDLTFAEEVYDSSGQLIQTDELIANGSRIAVTNDNKLQYLDSLAQYRLAYSVREEIESFLKGLNDIIPDNLLSIFDENELELLMCGTGKYSIADFQQNHTIIGNSVRFRKTLDWFWIIVSGLTQEELARLLQFTTGCSQLPPGGFSELSPKLQISSSPAYGMLPTAHTCFNQLCLPEYESVEQFHQSLLIAINEGNQGFGMV